MKATKIIEWRAIQIQDFKAFALLLQNEVLMKYDPILTYIRIVI